jgi:predicted nucleotidyltransferase
MGTAAAFSRALREASRVPLPDGFPSSNDLLGIAYIRALHLLHIDGYPMLGAEIVKRLGAAYRADTLTDGEYPSATSLRVLIREAACDPVALETILSGTMPESSLACLLEGLRNDKLPVDGDRLLPFLHAYYRLADPAAMEAPAECGGGIMGHICRVARETPSSAGFMEALRTKQYTDARLRRALLFGVLRVDREDLLMKPEYTTVLGANSRGRAFLREWRKGQQDEGWLPFSVVTKPADAPEGQQRFLAERADALFTLCYPTPRAAGDLYRQTPHMEN